MVSSLFRAFSRNNKDEDRRPDAALSAADASGKPWTGTPLQSIGRLVENPTADEEEGSREDDIDSLDGHVKSAVKAIRSGATSYEDDDDEATGSNICKTWGTKCYQRATQNKCATVLFVLMLSCFVLAVGLGLMAHSSGGGGGGSAPSSVGGSGAGEGEGEDGPSLGENDGGGGTMAAPTAAAPKPESGHAPPPTAETVPGTEPGTDSAPAASPIGPPASTAGADAAAASTSTARGHRTFSFYVMGDGPYSNAEWTILEEQLKGLSVDTLSVDTQNDHDEGSLFAVHVGDIMQSRRDCPLGKYTPVRDLFVDHSPLPTLMLPGDNDWMDCDDREEAWRFWSQNFVGMEEHWSATNSSSLMPNGNNNIANRVERDEGGRAENFAFAHNGILFVGIHVLKRDILSANQKSELDDILDHNRKWLRDQIDRYTFADPEAEKEEEEDGEEGEDDAIRAIVLFGHAYYRSFFQRIASMLRGTGVPVLYIHGNGHTYQMQNRKFQDNWDDFWTVQVDQIGIAPPIRVTVHGTTTKEGAREGGASSATDGAGVRIGDFISLDRRGGTEYGPLGLEEKMDVFSHRHP